MSDDLVNEHSHRSIQHEGETYISLLDARITFAFYQTHINHQAAEIARLRAELAAARQEGMEEAAKIADSCAADWTKSAIGKYINSKWDFQSRAEAGEEIAAAIRAAAKEGKP